jgi:hypothetical protein
MYLALVPELLQAVVPLPAVGVDDTPRLDGGEDEGVEAA